MSGRPECWTPNARGSWAVRRFRLGEEPRDDLSGSTTAAERLAMMWPLALEAWAIAGRPVPDLPRAETPVRKLPLACTDDR